MMSLLRLALLALLFLPAQLLAAADRYALVLVSDRSAARIVAAAHQYLQQAAELSIQVRTSSQINQLDDDQLQQLVAGAGQLLFLGIFAEPVERLLALPYSPTQTRIILNSDRRLLALHQDDLGGRFPALSSAAAQPLLQALNPSDGNMQQQLQALQQQWPALAQWLQMRAYWQNRGQQNDQALLNLLLHSGQPWQPVQIQQDERYFLYQAAQSQALSAAALGQRLAQEPARPLVMIIDHDSGDQAGEWDLHQQLCRSFTSALCVSALAAWGEASRQASSQLLQWASDRPALLISLQDFVIGGGDGREAVTRAFSSASIPVLKGIRLLEQNAASYPYSSEGIPADSVHYRIAMPELQGISQPQVLALASPAVLDRQTGARLLQSAPLPDEIAHFAQRAQNWLHLQQSANYDKRLAIIYYNHPPGRHNIGADNLNVVESLWQILQRLQREGYDLGDPQALPGSAAELLDLLQQKAVNLPQDASALQTMSAQVQSMSAATYRQWLQRQPPQVQAELEDGPLSALHQSLREYAAQTAGLDAQSRVTLQTLLQDQLHSRLHDIRYVLDGVRSQYRERALNLLGQLQALYPSLLQQPLTAEGWAQADALVQALLELRIEGLRGWGKAPGKVMVWNERLLLPGVQFGKVFLGPQPPRGWELNEELLHANMTFPPTHQYLAFYHFLADEFRADALIHLGRHSTYEFLPGKRTGLLASDYPRLVAADIPGIYPYIVDGVGEGIQAKRRGLAVMVDHLTPPLATTQLYDGLLELRQLIESAEAASDPLSRQKAVSQLRERIDALNLRDELSASMDEELQLRGIGFNDIDDEFLLHETGHYLTHLQEEFMPLGLHVFGRRWDDSAVATMLTSMQQDNNWSPERQSRYRQALTASPDAEMDALLNALKGRFVAPGKGNDPIRTPEALPTGRNFYALDASLLPSPTGAAVGRELAQKARAKTLAAGEKDAVILWASDAVRDEGAMIAFGLDLLGIEPVWNGRGIIKGLKRLPLSAARPQRRDVLFTSSGLFRDLYGSQLALLDEAVLLALAASRTTIERDYPALSYALQQTLAPVSAQLATENAGQDTVLTDEPLEQNLVARNWVDELRRQLQAQPSADVAELAQTASLRVFAAAPGSYGAGINRLAERSSAWQERSELADVFIRRMGHAYGLKERSLSSGSGRQQAYQQQLQAVANTYLGRASNLYGLMDNNDAFDYLGGLNLAVESLTGKAPASFVIDHSNNDQLQITSLQQALLGELRGRFLNRQWISPLMAEGYAGARTMGSEFIEYLWGWQVTSPQLIDDWVWEDVKAVYIDDSLQLGMQEFWQDGHNVQVQSNILAVMLVAADKGFWDADPATRQQLAQMLAGNIVRHGLPGSGHTHANHPLYEQVKRLIAPALAAELEQVLAASRLPDDSAADTNAPHHIQEIILPDDKPQEPAMATDGQSSGSAEKPAAEAWQYGWLLLLALLLPVAGMFRARRL